MPYSLRAYVHTEEQLCKSLKNSDLEYVYAPIGLIEGGFSGKEREKIIISPPVFLGGDESKIEKKLIELKNTGFNQMAVHTLDTLELGQRLGFRLFGSFRLNITNSLSAKNYSELGLSDIMLSVELSLMRAQRIRAISMTSDAHKRGMIVYGKLPLMLTRRCPVNDGRTCGKHCKKTLKDRKDNQLGVVCDTSVHILNPHPLVLSDKMTDFEGFDFQVLFFTDESDVNMVIDNYKNGQKPDGKFTRGLYYK